MSYKVPVGISNKHLHLSAADLEVLFGAGHQLTPTKDLKQPGQFACEEKVEVIGPKGSLKMSILGPARPASQVEISLSDARTLGVKAPVRESGDIAGTPGCTIKVGENTVEIAEGIIVAKRHIHFTPDEAAEFGVSDKEIVKVKIDAGRPLIFDDVVVRVNKNFSAAMHIDTDECNAAGAAGEVYGEIIK